MKKSFFLLLMMNFSLFLEASSQEGVTENCAICLDSLDAEADLRTLNCQHSFHRACLNKWFKRVSEKGYKEIKMETCPLCNSRGHICHEAALVRLQNLRRKYRRFSFSEPEGRIRHYLAVKNMILDGHQLTAPASPLEGLETVKNPFSVKKVFLAVRKILKEDFFRGILRKEGFIQVAFRYLNYPDLELKKAAWSCFLGLLDSDDKSFGNWCGRLRSEVENPMEMLVRKLSSWKGKQEILLILKVFLLESEENRSFFEKKGGVAHLRNLKKKRKKDLEFMRELIPLLNLFPKKNFFSCFTGGAKIEQEVYP